VKRQPAHAPRYGGWISVLGAFSAALPLAAAEEPARTSSNLATTPAEPPVSISSTPTPLQVPPPDCAQSVTPAQTEGPYYKPHSPERTSLLEPGMTGVRITVTGAVLTQSCQPIAGAWLDFWQANAQGEYDNRGYTLRGHQLTDAKGRYALETILPGRYPGRPPHLHVKVRAPGQPTLTTQLYFPEAQPYNRSDPFFNPSLLVTWLDTPETRIAFYYFVLDLK